MLNPAAFAATKSKLMVGLAALGLASAFGLVAFGLAAVGLLAGLAGAAALTGAASTVVELVGGACTKALVCVLGGDGGVSDLVVLGLQQQRHR